MYNYVLSLECFSWIEFVLKDRTFFEEILNCKIKSNKKSLFGIFFASLNLKEIAQVTNKVAINLNTWNSFFKYEILFYIFSLLLFYFISENSRTLQHF